MDRGTRTLHLTEPGFFPFPNAGLVKSLFSLARLRSIMLTLEGLTGLEMHPEVMVNLAGKEIG